MIALTKFAHIGALAIWCAGLIALPLILHAYGRGHQVRTQAGYSEFRLLAHRAYTVALGPAAVVAIAAGTILVFATEIRAPWLMAKLAAVAGLVLVHAWLGYVVNRSGEERGTWRIPSPLPALAIVTPLIALVLWLVLAKPDLWPLVDVLPGWTHQPLDRPLPPSLIPI